MSSPVNPGPAGVGRPVLLLSAACFCVSASMRAGEPLLPQIADEFAVSVGTASIVVTGYTLAYGLCQLISGPLGDRHGKYRVIAAAATVSAFVVAAAAAAPSLAALALLRLAAGATCAAVIPLSLAYVGDMVPYEARQAVLARILSGQLVGVVFGQAVGGIVMELAGWRAVFLLLGLAFGLIAIALWTELRSPRVGPAHGGGPLQAGSLARPYLTLLAAPGPRRVLFAIFAEGMLFFGTLAYLGAFLRHRFAIDYLTIGLVLGGFGLGGLGYSLSARRIVAALGERGMMRTGGVVLAASFVALSWLPAWGATVPFMVAIGFALYMMHNTLQTNATQMSAEARGSAVSLFALCLFLGQAAGVALLGLGVDHLGYGPVLTIAGLGLLALGFWFSRRR